MNKVFFLLLMTVITLGACQNGGGGVETTSGQDPQAAMQNPASAGQRSQTPQQSPQDLQRINENTFNASADPVSGSSDYGLNSFKGACERAVVSASWTDRMEVALEDCMLVVDIRQYGRTISWEVPLDKMDKGNMAPFLDAEYHPGFKLRSKGDAPVVRKTADGTVENVTEVQLVFADKQNASQAIFSMIKLIDGCE